MATRDPKKGTRWRIVHDVAVFQVKLGLEAMLDLTLIPTSLVAAALDVLVGNWRRPRFFHAVLRLGERCETSIDLWGVTVNDAVEPQPAVDAIIRRVEAMVRDPRTGPDTVRTLRRWAAVKLAGGTGDGPQSADRHDDAAP